MSLHEAIRQHFADDPEALRRFEESSRRAAAQAESRRELFIDADAYAIPDIPLRLGGAYFLLEGDLPLREFVAASTGESNDVDVALRLFKKNHPEVPDQLLIDHLGVAQLARIFSDFSARLSATRSELFAVAAGRDGGQEGVGGVVLAGPGNGNGTGPVIPFGAADPA